MDQSHLRRRHQEVRASIRKTDSGHTRCRPGSDAKITLPGFLAKLATLDLDGLLPAKILRLLVG
jgi:hypothetical protein